MVVCILWQHGHGILSDNDYKTYCLMKDFSHRVGDILEVVADILRPQDFEQLVEYGFSDMRQED